MFISSLSGDFRSIIILDTLTSRMQCDQCYHTLIKNNNNINVKSSGDLRSIS